MLEILVTHVVIIKPIWRLQNGGLLRLLVKMLLQRDKNDENYLFRLAYKQYFSTKNISNYLSYIKYFKLF